MTKITTTVEFSKKAKSRLLRLAKLLRADARRTNGVRFDMSVYGTSKTEPGLDCGTRACALGLAALSGEFKWEGLGFKISDDGWHPGTKTIDFTYKGKDHDHEDAGALTFDIPICVATWLFGTEAPKHKTGAKAEKEMAEIIEKAVKGDLPADIVEDIRYEIE